MGLFDYVEFDPPLQCVKCHEILDGFQTKDSPDQFMYKRRIENAELLTDVAFDRWKVDGTKEPTTFQAEDDPAMTWRVYDSCENCKYWNEYILVIVNQIVIHKIWVDSKINAKKP